MRKIVLINQSSGYLMIDIANAYAQHYDEVILITGKIKIMERTLDRRVKVSKIINYSKKSVLNRIFTWGYATLQIALKLGMKYRNSEILFVTNPPTSYFTALYTKRDFSILVYDIFPDALLNFGVKNNSFFYNKWANINKKVFKKARCVFTLSSGMAEQLGSYADKEKIRVIPNWAASTSFKPIHRKENKFIIKNNFDDKFIVMYSGNIGQTHNVESIIKIAEKLNCYDDIAFIIIGDGMKKQSLVNETINRKLNNCHFFDWQSREMFPFSLCAADIGVITLTEDTAKVSVPSKTYNLLAAGKPLLCLAPKNSEINRIVTKYSNGICAESGSIDEMAEFILKVKMDPDLKSKLSQNSLKASGDFTFKNASLYVNNNEIKDVQ